MLSQWFFGSTGPPSKSLSTGRRLAVFTALTVFFYAWAWLAFDAVRPAYHKALNIGAERYYDLEGKSLKFWRAGSDTVFRSYMNPPFEAQLSPRAILSNLPFLAALLLAAPGIRPRRRLLLLGAAIALLYLSQVAFLVTKVEVSLISAGHPRAGSPGFWKSLDNFLEVTGKTFFPVAIWLGLTLRYMLGLLDSPSQTPSGSRVGRNEPCPCGSGKKYKNCCAKS